MIRINLLPQQRPKKTRAAAVSAGASAQLILLAVGVLAGFGVLAAMWVMKGNELTSQQQKLTTLQSEKARLEKVKAEVENYERQKAILDQRIAIIQELQRNKVGGQELLDVMANTVNKTDTLWLTLMSRKGNTLTIEGTAASITAVANFITNLKRAGYFEKVEIKESRQDDKNKAVQTFLFTLTADFVLPGSKPPDAAASSGAQGKV
jgi:type IV pilus assembly protein PilN